MDFPSGTLYFPTNFATYSKLHDFLLLFLQQPDYSLLLQVCRPAYLVVLHDGIERTGNIIELYIVYSFNCTGQAKNTQRLRGRLLAVHSMMVVVRWDDEDISEQQVMRWRKLVVKIIKRRT
jgi:hypothetical protein